MRVFSLLAVLRTSDKRARSLAARQRLEDELFPALGVTRLEERRLLNAAPVVVTPAPTVKDAAVDAAVAPDAPSHDEAGSDINNLAVTMYGGPAKGDFSPEMHDQLQNVDATTPANSDTTESNSLATSSAANAAAFSDPLQLVTGFSQPANLPPVNVVPGAQATNEDTALLITGLSVSDADAGGFPITTQLAVNHGTLSIDTSGGAVQPSGAILMPDGTVTVSYTHLRAHET